MIDFLMEKTPVLQRRRLQKLTGSVCLQTRNKFHTDCRQNIRRHEKIVEKHLNLWYTGSIIKKGAFAMCEKRNREERQGQIHMISIEDLVPKDHILRHVRWCERAEKVHPTRVQSESPVCWTVHDFNSVVR